MFNKYQVIKGAISYELANFIFNYFLLKRDAVKFMYENNNSKIEYLCKLKYIAMKVSKRFFNFFTIV